MSKLQHITSIEVEELEEGDALELPPREEKIILKKDEKFESKFTPIEELGKGKFGVVKSCRDKKTGTLCAAKYIRKTDQSVKDVYREIEIMNLLHHKRLINLLDAYDVDQYMIVVMELITGGELFEKVVLEDNLTERQVVRYMRQVLFGLQHMHRKGIVHLDLKPENILCVGGGKSGYEELKLIDFGMSRKLEPGKETRVACGTAEFVSPEVLNSEPVSLASDMWSIGVITYILMSGLSPFMGENDSETMMNVANGEYDFDDGEDIFNQVSDDAKMFIQQLLVLDPKQRNTVDDCLNHIWFVNTKQEKKLKTQRLKKFIIRRRWQRATNAIKAISRLDHLGHRNNNHGKALSLAHSLPATPAAATNSAAAAEETLSSSDAGHITNGASENNLGNEVKLAPATDSESIDKQGNEHEHPKASELPSLKTENVPENAKAKEKAKLQHQDEINEQAPVAPDISVNDVPATKCATIYEEQTTDTTEVATDEKKQDEESITNVVRSTLSDSVSDSSNVDMTAPERKPDSTASKGKDGICTESSEGQHALVEIHTESHGTNAESSNDKDENLKTATVDSPAHDTMLTDTNSASKEGNSINVGKNAVNNFDHAESHSENYADNENIAEDSICASENNQGQVVRDTAADETNEARVDSESCKSQSIASSVAELKADSCNVEVNNESLLTPKDADLEISTADSEQNNNDIVQAKGKPVAIRGMGKFKLQLSKTMVLGDSTESDITFDASKDAAAQVKNESDVTDDSE